MNDLNEFKWIRRVKNELKVSWMKNLWIQVNWMRKKWIEWEKAIDRQFKVSINEFKHNSIGKKSEKENS